MRLINTEGLALIGPGSEWFWTAVSGIILAVTFIAIYRQLRIARSATAFEQVDRLRHEWDSERMNRYVLDVCTALKAGVDPADIPEGAAAYLSDFWDSIGQLVQTGHIDRALMHRAYGDACRWWWAALEANNLRFRRETGNENAGSDFEWLSVEMTRLDTKAGRRQDYNLAFVMRTLDRRIERAEDEVRIGEALRGQVEPRRGSTGTRIGHTRGPAAAKPSRRI